MVCACGRIEHGTGSPTGHSGSRERAPREIVDVFFELHLVFLPWRSTPDHASAPSVHWYHSQGSQHGSALGRIGACQELLQFAPAISVVIPSAIPTEVPKVGHFPVVIHPIS